MNMDKCDVEWIKKWKPYEQAFELTSKLLFKINGFSRSSHLKPSPNTPLYKYRHVIENLKIPLKLRLFKGNATSPELMNHLFDLMKTNMKVLYDETNFYGGWDDRKKLAEMKYYKTHIIALFNYNSLIGFTSYRFIVMRECQDPTPALYIYELQIKESYRNNGLGKFLISVLELVALSVNCKKLMCTVLKSNERAVSFYMNKCDFVVDESDPDTEYKVLKLELKKL
ncbi:N-terminal L-serine N(alpha)-acetyltransferase NatD [Theileria orientalis]|uniref:N-alpha-acetyltransferase 40 n=1 Tax=Theileria orientalis TaxID=68886 RepID=A0A976MCV7_THEOR|nr:N-terminal L-serine N(alpha)-acetyltransferase NatD [Theileria orientalis]